MPVHEAKNAYQAVTISQQEVFSSSRLPPAFRFPLLVLLSLTLSSLSYTLAARYTAEELASVSRKLDQWWEVAALVGWRIFQLGLGWFGDYDSYDLASLSLLSHGPTLYLLGSFYNIRTTTTISCLLINILTTYIPFRLLRPLSPGHAASTSGKSAALANKDIVTDYTIQASTTFLSASIYSVVLYAAYVTYLPKYLVTYFSELPSVAAAHSATPITLLPLTLLLGLASKTFIFTPAVAAAPTKARAEPFNPVTATLNETFWHNIWGFGARTKIVIKRTLAAALVSGINTFALTLVTVRGVQATGAVAYSLVWVVSAGITGTVLGFVGAV